MAKLASIGIRLPEEQRDALREWAEYDHRSVASLVEIELDKVLKARPPELLAAIKAHKAEKDRAGAAKARAARKAGTRA